MLERLKNLVGEEFRAGMMVTVVIAPVLATAITLIIAIRHWVDMGNGWALLVASVFNSDRYPYFEMETHGPLVRLPPGGRYEIEERQALCDMASWPEHENQVRQYLS